MLFMLHCVIEPENRDENLSRLRDMMIGEPGDVRVLNSWLSVTQLEGWVIFEAPSADSLVRLFHQWTDLNVNYVHPVLEVKDMLAALDGKS